MVALKKQKCIPSQFYRSDSKSRHQQIRDLSEGFRKKSFLVFSNFWWLHEVLDLQVHNFSLCLVLLMTLFSVFLVSPLLSLLMTLVIGFGTHSDNAGQSHLEIFNLIMYTNYHSHKFQGFRNGHIFQGPPFKPLHQVYPGQRLFSQDPCIQRKWFLP